MTLRILFVIFGSLTMIAASAMAWMRWQATGSIRQAIELYRSGEDRIAHLVVSELLLLLAFAAGGLRILVVNATHLDDPIRFVGPFDRWTAIITILFGALAAVYRLSVYLLYRRYPENENSEG